MHPLMMMLLYCQILDRGVSDVAQSNELRVLIVLTVNKISKRLIICQSYLSQQQARLIICFACANKTSPTAPSPSLSDARFRVQCNYFHRLHI